MCGPLLTVVLVAVVAWQPLATMAAPLNILDMTYVTDENSQYWGAPYQKAPNLTEFSDVMGINSLVFANNFQTGEHASTHIDSPNHMFIKDHDWSSQYDTADIPIEDLFGPAVMIDVKDKVQNHVDNNYEISLQEVQEYELKYGRIPEGALIFSCTGWTDKINDSVAYWGGDRNVLGEWNFPGFSVEATDWLIAERNIKGLASDSPSCEQGQTKTFPVHISLFRNNKWCIESAARTCDLPPAGATAYALPIRIRGSSGFPLRVMATWGRDAERDPNRTEKDEDNKPCNGGGSMRTSLGVMLSSFLLIVWYVY